MGGPEKLGRTSPRKTVITYLKKKRIKSRVEYATHDLENWPPARESSPLV